ncbi:hypothetical protein EDC40_103441 [Aminobacter aminovorans]|uniref:Uncharacterized protein n=1 Tax=Aminobacter aminovorans TaxID=83263 RepID=A0A380WN45_AMIAI|nr:hypothetical protein [Aminobacter aminovorans]TCS27974.1 hypothetical protein EDC40_103441 [Aminobacter aminovorans]SUU89614.1 Uncharacterised protein [Aminobacter aminovorans]
MKYREVQERLRAVGIVVSKRAGVIRLNYFGGFEQSALYAIDLQEALNVGLKMAEAEHVPTGWLEDDPSFPDKASHG